MLRSAAAVPVPGQDPVERPPEVPGAVVPPWPPAVPTERRTRTPRVRFLPEPVTRHRFRRVPPAEIGWQRCDVTAHLYRPGESAESLQPVPVAAEQERERELATVDGTSHRQRPPRHARGRSAGPSDRPGTESGSQDTSQLANTIVMVSGRLIPLQRALALQIGRG